MTTRILHSRKERLLATILLARMDGKSPLEYFTDPAKRDTVRGIAARALNDDSARIDDVIATVESRLP